MSDDAHDRILERIRLGRAARVESLTTPAASSGSAASRGILAPTIGARVFDVQRGQDGVVVRPPAGAAIEAGKVYVQYDQGVTCARSPRDLLVRPTPPPARG